VNSRLLDHACLGLDLPEVAPSHPFRLEFRRWLEENAPTLAEPIDLTERIQFRRAWHTAMADDRWTAVHWPAEYGGRGADPLLQFMYYEELALARAPELLNAPGLILLGPTLMVHGTENLRKRFLPGILSGSELWCQGFSEPDAGSDLASLRTRAELVNDQWVINGQKTWTTFAQFADFCFVLARTEVGSERHRGLTVLICPMDQPGVTVRPIRQISGDAEFCEVFFDDAQLPRDWVVGSAGSGWSVAMTAFGFERGDQGFTDHARLLVRLLDAERSLAEAIREKRLASGLVAQKRSDLARCWAGCQELRMLNYRAALLRRAGQDTTAIGSITNLVWGELEKNLGSLHAEILTWDGLSPDNRTSLHRLASRAASIYSGTSEIQRNIIAERLLGLPR
jgi:alkylation response protein AidB-like acyl-CoA dehydrogenase